MHATARLVAACDRGRGHLPVVRSQTPLLIRRTGTDGARVRVHLVGGAAGPLGGDLLRLEIEVGPGAHLEVRTVAASLALPGPPGAVSRVEVDATVATGARLDWLPEPLVAAAGCRHEAVNVVRLAKGAALTWRDELVCGRHRESPGQSRVSLAVSYRGQPLYQQELAVGAQAPGWDGPAVLDGARATGSLLWVDPSWDRAPGSMPPEREPVLLGPTAALLPLAGPGLLASATGADAAALRRTLDAAALTVERAAHPADRSECY